jgi:hypothetical protein
LIGKPECSNEDELGLYLGVGPAGDAKKLNELSGGATALSLCNVARDAHRGSTNLACQAEQLVPWHGLRQDVDGSGEFNPPLPYE